MDKIKSDALLVKILSFLPTKDAVRTSVLSKKWKFLWMWLSKLEYDDNMLRKSTSVLMRLWADKNLPLHRAPVIDSLRLFFRTYSFQPEDVKFFVVNAVFRSVRELSVCYYVSSANGTCALLPSNLYISKSLVALKLEGSILVDVPHMVCLLSLKTLVLGSVVYGDDALQRILSNCPVLEDLTVRQCSGCYCELFSIISPSLQRLTIELSPVCFYRTGFVIETPSLKYFKFLVHDLYYDYSDGVVHATSSYAIQHMPKLEDVDFCLKFYDIQLFVENFVRPITSVKRFSLCLQLRDQEDICNESIVFHKLEHLKICSCQQEDWTILLFRLLKDSPNLQELEVYFDNDHGYLFEDFDPLVCWNHQPSDVPGCLLRSLKTFKWTEFYGSEKKMDLVKYILKNACYLKNATILSHSPYDPKEKLEMIEELSLAPRASTSCQLTFFQRI